MSTDTSWASVLRVRSKNVASRVVQAVGFYLVFAAVIDLFSAVLESGGIPISAVPDAVWQPYLSIGISPLFVMLIGMGIVWFSTSAWFLGPVQK